MCECLCESVCVHTHGPAHMCIRKPEEGVKSPRPGVTSGYKSPDMDAGN